MQVPPPVSKMHDHAYFIPSMMEPDPEESSGFFGSRIFIDGMAKAATSVNQLFYITNVTDLFPKTTEMVNHLLSTSGLKTKEASLFVASSKAAVQRLHCDATNYQGDTCMLEARFSFYGLTKAPGLISWWGDDAGVVLESGPVMVNGRQVGNRAGYISEWSRKDLPWDQMPEPLHTVSTDIPSGFVRTNLPHTVFQGNGIRITLSYMIVDLETGNPTGVWERIKTLHG